MASPEQSEAVAPSQAPVAEEKKTAANADSNGASATLPISPPNPAGAKKPESESEPKPAPDPTTLTATPAAEVEKLAETVLHPPPALAPIKTTSPTTSRPLSTATTGNDEEPDNHNNDGGVNPLDFEESVNSNNDLPSAETLAEIANYVLLDRDGKTHTFKSLYTGKHVARRVLIIFVRHFYCGNCQQYLASLSSSITPDALLRLPISTFIAVIGCGDPGLIDMYAAASGCPFPIYADPTRKLYDALGMVRTLAMGNRPAYMKTNMVKSSLSSIMQGLGQIKSGLATKGGDARQIGGEFLFEPLDLQSPVSTPWAEVERRMGDFALDGKDLPGSGQRSSEASLDGKNGGGSGEDDGAEEKRVTWCHRMKTTRDHAEIPELMEVLGLDGQGMPIKDKKRWSRALEERKGTGLSMASQMSAMKADENGGGLAGAVAP